MSRLEFIKNLRQNRENLTKQGATDVVPASQVPAADAIQAVDAKRAANLVSRRKRAKGIDDTGSPDSKDDLSSAAIIVDSQRSKHKRRRKESTPQDSKGKAASETIASPPKQHGNRTSTATQMPAIMTEPVPMDHASVNTGTMNPSPWHKTQADKPSQLVLPGNGAAVKASKGLNSPILPTGRDTPMFSTASNNSWNKFN